MGIFLSKKNSSLDRNWFIAKKQGFSRVINSPTPRAPRGRGRFPFPLGMLRSDPCGDAHARCATHCVGIPKRIIFSTQPPNLPNHHALNYKVWKEENEQDTRQTRKTNCQNRALHKKRHHAATHQAWHETAIFPAIPSPR